MCDQDTRTVWDRFLSGYAPALLFLLLSPVAFIALWYIAVYVWLYSMIVLPIIAGKLGL